MANVNVVDWMKDAASQILTEAAKGSIDAEQAKAIVESHCPFKKGFAYLQIAERPDGTVQDWATEAARYIAGDHAMKNWRIPRIAAVVATCAKPMTDLLNEARQMRTCGCSVDDKLLCVCGATEWNDRIDRAIAGSGR